MKTSYLCLLLLGLAGPAWAYRPLRGLPASNQDSPVVITDLSSSLQDNAQIINAVWDTTLSFRLAPKIDARAIQSVDVELTMLDSQGELLERRVTRIAGNWGGGRQVRLQTSYLGWPASTVRGKVIQVNYSEGEPWVPEPRPPVQELPPKPDDLSLATDSEYIKPTVLSSNGTTSNNQQTIRPSRPRPVRPRIVPQPVPQAVPQPNTPTSTSSSPFGQPPFTNRTNQINSSQGKGQPQAPQNQPPTSQSGENEDQK